MRTFSTSTASSCAFRLLRHSQLVGDSLPFTGQSAGGTFSFVVPIARENQGSSGSGHDEYGVGELEWSLTRRVGWVYIPRSHSMR